MLKWGLSERGSNLLKSDRPLASLYYRVYPPPGEGGCLLRAKR